jgi:hypothetical protein
MGTDGSFGGGKAAQALSSPITIAEVKKTWIYISTPPYLLMAKCIIKHRDYVYFFTFT